MLLLWAVLNSFFFLSDLNVEEEKRSVLFPSLNPCMNCDVFQISVLPEMSA